MRLLGWIGALGVFFGVCGGCGKVEGGKALGDAMEGDVAPLARADLAPAFGKLLCPDLADCCAQQDIQVDEHQCQAQLTQLLETTYAQQARTTTYDAAAAAQCLQAWPSVVTSCGIRKRGVPAPEACLRIFVGHAKLGAACYGPDDCEASASGSVVCNFESADGEVKETGTCMLDKHGRLGDACQASCGGGGCAASPVVGPGSPDAALATCFEEDGLYCDGTQHCVALLAMGSACTYTDACAGGGSCQGGTCQALLADGVACKNDETCQSGACVNGACGDPVPSALGCTSGSF